jgi:ferredoxin
VLAVDPIACAGHGICAELMPERVSLDDWGYPIVDPTPLPAALEPLAARAVTSCPTLALSLRRATPAEAPGQRAQPGRGRGSSAR